MTDFIRDLVPPTLSMEYFQERVNAGWVPVAVEWTRPSPTSKAAHEPMSLQPPYGFRIAADGKRLETEPEELNVLYVLLEEIVRDRRFTQIADELNKRKLRTRSGLKWTNSAVFDLLPSLVEAGPVLTKSDEWIRRRVHLTASGVAGGEHLSAT